MGMRISGSTSTGESQSVGMVAWQQRQQNSKDLFAALKSGDLVGAQKAFAALTGGAKQVNSNSPLSQIGQALQNGDLAGAQKAAQQIQAKHGGGHHHHHITPVASGATTTASTETPTSSGPGGLLNVKA